MSDTFSEKDVEDISKMAYSEAANQPDSVVKMVAQTAINRMRSGRTKEFGESIPDVLSKGYHSVSRNSPLYSQADKDEFPDLISRYRKYDIQVMVWDMVKKQDFGNAMFFFTDKEQKRLRSSGFDFGKVKPTGKVGPYNTYSY